MVSLLASGQEIVWDLDVALGANASIPNLLGLSFLQRFLASRGLLDVRRGNSDDGLVVVEAMWRICEALAARPEVIAPLVALNQARYAEGVLRKIPAPAYGWSERLREQKLYAALLVALQNAPWAAAKNSESVGDAAIFARIHRRFVEGLVAASACEWSRGALTHEFEVAAGAEEDPERAIATMFSTSIVDIATRSFRFLLDSEFTAMVVEARIDRFVARDGQWPDKLSHLESAVCPGRFYTYRKGNGAFLEFPPPAPKDDSPNLNLPLTFRGAPPPTPTPTSRPPVLTPTPSAHRLLKR
jgi:hypothetical protein